MENVPLLCDLAAATALIQEWGFSRSWLTGHSLSAPLCAQTHLTLFQLNPVSRAHRAEMLDRKRAVHLGQNKMCAAELKL